MSRIFICKDYRGDFELEIGDLDTLTFGPAIPYPSRAEGRRPGPGSAYSAPPGVPQVYAIRVYEPGGKMLKAVFTGVYEIRAKDIRKTALAPEVGEIPMPREEEDLYAGDRVTLAEADGRGTATKPEGGWIGGL